MNRRTFLQIVSGSSAAALLEPSLLAQPSKPAAWPIGCFNRPWTKWSYDESLDGVKSAGYKLTGLLTRSKDDPFIGVEATPSYLSKLKEKIAERGLKANMASLRSRHNIPAEDSILEVRKQLDNAKTLGLEYVLSFGVDRPDQYEHFYKVMTDAAAYAQDRGLKLVLKPHGGGSGAAEEILRCLGQVKHPNFKIWYDAGNIIHYTGKDPLAELEPIASHVTGFCAKDCARKQGDVMIQFGEGKVDFKAVFAKLKTAGFNGPIMVECAAPAPTPDGVTANARANREFLEKAIAAVS